MKRIIPLIIILLFTASSCKYQYYNTETDIKVQNSDKLVKTTYQGKIATEPKINEPTVKLKLTKTENYWYKTQKKVTSRRHKTRVGEMLLSTVGAFTLSAACFYIIDWDAAQVPGSPGSYSLEGKDALFGLVGTISGIVGIVSLFQNYESSEYKYKYKYVPTDDKFKTIDNIPLANASVIVKSNGISPNFKTDYSGYLSLKMSDFNIPKRLENTKKYTFKLACQNTEFDNYLSFDNTEWMSSYIETTQPTNMYFTKSLEKSELMLPKGTIGSLYEAYRYPHSYKIYSYKYYGYIPQQSVNKFYATNYTIPNNASEIENKQKADFKQTKILNTTDTYLKYLTNYYQSDKEQEVFELAANSAKNSLNDQYKYIEFFTEDSVRKEANTHFSSIFQEACQLAYNELSNYETFSDYSAFYEKYPLLTDNEIIANSLKNSGKFIWWHKNGNKKKTGTFLDNEKDGLFTVYFEDETKKEEFPFK